MVTDYKNLEYFTTTKKLIQRQVRWSEYLSCFNTKIRFRPGRLGAKPDALTRRWDIYQGNGKTDNLMTNTKPVFSTDQLATPNIAARMNSLTPSEPPYTNILDLTTIFDSISSMMDDTFAQKIIKKLNSTTPPVGWNWQANRLYYEQQLYVPDHENLHLQVIHNHHNHPMAGHFGQTKTINLIKWNFHWPGLGQMMKSYI